MNKYVITKSWKQSVDRTVRAGICQRKYGDLCFSAAHVWAGLLLSTVGPQHTQYGVFFNVSQMDVSMLEVWVSITPLLTRSAFDISHSHVLSLAPQSWLSPVATGQVGGLGVLSAQMPRPQMLCTLTEACILSSGILGRHVRLNSICPPLFNVALLPLVEALSYDSFRVACSASWRSPPGPSVTCTPGSSAGGYRGKQL